MSEAQRNWEHLPPIAFCVDPLHPVSFIFCFFIGRRLSPRHLPHRPDGHKRAELDGEQVQTAMPGGFVRHGSSDQLLLTLSTCSMRRFCSALQSSSSEHC